MVGVIGLPLATVMGYGRKDAVEPREEAAFGAELKSAITVDERQDIVAASGNRPTRDVETDWLAPIPAAKTGSVFELENPIPKVQDLLIKMGINPAEIQFELLDDLNSNPLGTGHVNHFMRVRMPNGWKEDFAVEYINRNASITAHEIAALKRLGAAPDHLRGV